MYTEHVESKRCRVLSTALEMEDVDSASNTWKSSVHGRSEATFVRHLNAVETRAVACPQALLLAAAAAAARPVRGPVGGARAVAGAVLLAALGAVRSAPMPGFDPSDPDGATALLGERCEQGGNGSRTLVVRQRKRIPCEYSWELFRECFGCSANGWALLGVFWGAFGPWGTFWVRLCIHRGAPPGTPRSTGRPPCRR